MSLTEYRNRLPYGVGVAKRQKHPTYVVDSGLPQRGSKGDIRLVQVSRTPKGPEFDVSYIPHLGFYRTRHGVKVLNGMEYSLVGEIFAGVKTAIVSRRAAVDDSIDDGAIDYDRLAVYITRMQVAGRIDRLSHRINDPEADAPLVEHFAQAVLGSGDILPRSVIISITGSLVEKTAKHFEVDWYGGGKLTVSRRHAEGNWEELQVGQWFEATISRKMSGEVVRAMLIGPIDEPQGFTAEELTESYSSIPAAKLDPVR